MEFKRRKHVTKIRGYFFVSLGTEKPILFWIGNMKGEKNLKERRMKKVFLTGPASHVLTSERSLGSLRIAN